VVELLQYKPTKCAHFFIISIIFNIHKLLRVSALAYPSSGSVQLFKTIVRHYFQLQNVELSEVHQCMIYRHRCVKVIGAACRCECVCSRSWW